MSDALSRLAIEGFALIEGVLNIAEVEVARRSCTASLVAPAAAPFLLVREGEPPHGARNLLRLWPDSVALTRHSRLRDLLLQILGLTAGVVRGLYFDKPPGNSWALPWHRDSTISVKAHREFTTYTKPTLKAGLPHVEAPVSLLARMLTARIHLDDATEQNGPLRLIPGSHILGPDSDKRPPLTIHCRAGDVLLMRPLLLHASGHCDPAYLGHRRIIHLEFAPEVELSEGYEWGEFVGLLISNEMQV